MTDLNNAITANPDLGPSGEDPNGPGLDNSPIRDPHTDYLVPASFGDYVMTRDERKRFVYQNPRTWPEAVQSQRGLVDSWKLAEDARVREGKPEEVPTYPTEQPVPRPTPTWTPPDGVTPDPNPLPDDPLHALTHTYSHVCLSLEELHTKLEELRTKLDAVLKLDEVLERLKK